MLPLAHRLGIIIGEAFESCGLPAEMGRVTVSDRPDLAQFQCNGAMAAAKKAGKNPRAVAEEIVVRLQTRPEFSKIEIAGPGFININITDAYLSGYLKEAAADDRLGIPATGKGTIVLDYGGPNIAKPMHVGHLRTAIIGESLRRIVAFLGYRALGDVHMGDWGTHMGMIISEYIDTGRADAVMQTDITDGAEVAALMDDLSALYPVVAAACKENEARRARALEATVQIQNREPAHYALWEKMRQASIIGMRANYALLDVHFDLWKGEADVHDLIAPMVEDLKKKGLAREDDGAVIVPVAQEGDKKEMPPLILYKRDGAVMYGTTDLATIVERMNLYSPEKIIYVVDQRQHLHFEQVFRAARLAALVPEGVELIHAGFGTMNGADGKPFKTRAGGVMRLEDMLNMAMEKARARLAEAELAQDMSAVEREDVARKVAIAAIKFGDLQNQRQADYVFDLDRLTSFEGKTGPYILYQAVRIKSLLRKAQEQGAGQPGILSVGDADRTLALALGAFPDSVRAAFNGQAPHHLCDYAFRLAQTFSSFYAACHILSEKDEALRRSRLALCDLTYRTFDRLLSLLGIALPERM